MNQYREGKVKRTPVRGVKEYLKPYAYKQWEGYAEFCIEDCRLKIADSNHTVSISI